MELPFICFSESYFDPPASCQSALRNPGRTIEKCVNLDSTDDDDVYEAKGNSAVIMPQPLNAEHHRRQFRTPVDSSESCGGSGDSDPEEQCRTISAKKLHVGSERMVSRKSNRKRKKCRNRESTDSDAETDDKAVKAKRSKITSFRCPRAVESSELIDSDVDVQDNVISTKQGRASLVSSGGKSSSIRDAEVNATFKSRKRAGVRVSWSQKELGILRSHFMHLEKPPGEETIRSLCQRYPMFNSRTIPQIKSRAWHMITTGR
jgi:hypothetical protein